MPETQTNTVPPPPPPCSETYVEALNEDAARVNYKFRYVWNFLANFHDQLLAKFESYQFNLACKLDFQEWYRIIRDLMDSYKYLMMTGGDCIGLLGPNTHTRPDCALLIQMYEMEIPDKEAKVDEFYAEAVRLTNPRAALGGGWKLCGEVFTEPPTPIGVIPPMTPPPAIAPLPVVQPPLEPPPVVILPPVIMPLPNNGVQTVTVDPVTTIQTVVIEVPPAAPVVTVIPGPTVPAVNYQPALWELCIGAIEECNTKRDELITLMDQYLDAFAETQGWISNKMDTYDLNSDCWHYHRCWWEKGTEEKDAIQKLFNVKLNDLPLADWDCPNNTTWRDKYDAYKKQLAFLESLVDLQGSLNRRFQRVEYAKACPWLCTDAVSAYQPNMQQEPERSSCFLAIGATRNLYLAQIARINAINMVISDKQKQLYLTRNQYNKNSPCWKFFEAWFQACKTVSNSIDAPLNALASAIDFSIDCTFDTGWEAKNKVNAEKVAAIKVLVDAYSLMANEVTTVGPEGFNDCDNKNPL